MQRLFIAIGRRSEGRAKAGVEGNRLFQQGNRRQIVGVGQLGGDAEAVGLFADRALQDIAHAKVAGGLPGIDGLVAVGSWNRGR